ncbi:hypothetical protein ACH196_25440 [Mesorhizobium sp. IMUNJ23232]
MIFVLMAVGVIMLGYVAYVFGRAAWAGGRNGEWQAAIGCTLLSASCFTLIAMVAIFMPTVKQPTCSIVQDGSANSGEC